MPIIPSMKTLSRLLRSWPIGIFSATLALTPAAWSCSCMGIQDWAAHARKASMIFTAKVVKAEQPPIVKDANGNILFRSDSPIRYTLQVTHAIKGLSESREIILKSAMSSASCGYGFQIDSDYLVFPYQVQEDSVLWTGLCTGTMSLKESKAQGILDTVVSATSTSVRDRRISKARQTHKISAPQINQPRGLLGRKATPDKGHP